MVRSAVVAPGGGRGGAERLPSIRDKTIVGQLPKRRATLQDSDWRLVANKSGATRYRPDPV
jgi:hypothetical protein